MRKVGVVTIGVLAVTVYKFYGHDMLLKYHQRRRVTKVVKEFMDYMERYYDGYHSEYIGTVG